MTRCAIALGFGPLAKYLASGNRQAEKVAISNVLAVAQPDPVTDDRSRSSIWLTPRLKLQTINSPKHVRLCGPCGLETAKREIYAQKDGTHAHFISFFCDVVRLRYAGLRFLQLLWRLWKMNVSHGSCCADLRAS
jgi:hypothetical protein